MEGNALHLHAHGQGGGQQRLPLVHLSAVLVAQLAAGAGVVGTDAQQALCAGGKARQLDQLSLGVKRGERDAACLRAAQVARALAGVCKHDAVRRDAQRADLRGVAGTAGVAGTRDI